MLEVRSSRLGARLAWRVRWVAVRGVAAALAGVVVLGIGGRVAMFLSRLLHPDAIGRFTENGNRIGEFTVEGTVALLLFGGLASGLSAGVVWAVVKQWVPSSAAASGAGVVAIGGFLLIESDNPDFEILEGPAPDLALLVGLLFAFGATLHWLDGWLDDRLPEARGILSRSVYAIVAGMGVPLTIPTFGSFFSREFCFCEHPPVWTGVFLVGSTVATLVWWVSHLRGAGTPSPTTQLVGRSSLALAVTAGAIHLTGQIVAIF